MKAFLESLINVKTTQLLDPGIPLGLYTPVDLSVSNKALNGIHIASPDTCQRYIDQVLIRNGAMVAYGGYLEQRNLYSGNADFESHEERRDIHLGVDFWSEAGTEVVAPLKGEVHSYQNNATKGDYGPTIILKHRLRGTIFYTLYGHLSPESISELFVGKVFEQGETLATLGTTDVNVNYAPHLHFQLIVDLQGQQGDYPGVCRASEVDFYQKNCPDPNILLKM
ncbi:MAG: peptidoglycan DD-metalloendopeptidase family protein [Eudoraea sp.]|nr:peptidoglycan DD-metalloendopeptidase family protein [Eudoraea sp.]